jgi:hypothetical protein
MKNNFRTMLLLAIILIAGPKIYAQVSINVSIQANVAPPEIPVYEQPACPDDGYLWQPGYWAWDPDAADYYWVPGVWVAAPQPGYLWTPCYWGYEGSAYIYHPGYWGQHVGFYGGINYGGGFFGIGFAGGEWQGNQFRYNTAVVNVNTTVIHNTYVDRTVINNSTIVNNHVSYNGGSGGVTAKPRPEELQAMHEPHLPPTSEQTAHQQTAHADKSQFAKANNGHPAMAAINKVNADHVAPKNTGSNPTATDNRDPQVNKPAVSPGTTPAVSDQQHAKQPAQPQQDQQHAQPQTVQPKQQPVQTQKAQPQQPRTQQQHARSHNNKHPAAKPPKKKQS